MTKGPDVYQRVIAVLGLVFVTGCAATPEEIAAHDAKYALKAQREYCQQSIEVFPPGMQPQRPFRVLGPVEAHWNLTAEGRFKTMRRKACDMGAHAIMDAADNTVYHPGATTTYVDAWGRPVVVAQQPGGARRYASAMAIVYIDLPPMSGPQSAAAPPPPAPQN
jgi:hypothetical protein